jgi:phosphoribosylformylglycinamidine synthase
MLVWAGAEAFSAFQLDKLLAAVRACVPRIVGLVARHEHCLCVDRTLTASEEQKLRRLLGDEPAPAQAGESLLVIPRVGTISPWSSKATDIVHSCGFDVVRRVERVLRFGLRAPTPLTAAEINLLAPLLHDRMTQTLLGRELVQDDLFAVHAPAALRTIPLMREGLPALERADRELGLALSPDEMSYLAEKFGAEQRDPTDAELMMFAQANSEHCRHKIFNARWVIDGEEQASSLFQMIRSTHAANPAGVLSAYRDNAAVIEGAVTAHLFADPASGAYRSQTLPVHTLMKVETHNHPTAISPFPGAATGSGGELRDEGATGRGGRPKAGLTGFSVSNLAVPDWPQPWEFSPGRPERIASPLQIMLEGPIGAASFNNEFGRPNIAGYFRTYEQPDAAGKVSARGYHKPIMIAGGLGNISGADVEKAEVPVGALLIVLGGPAMLIGLGGGAASSVGSGTSAVDLDFASVQRGNPEIERRAQQVIEACRARAALEGVPNPVIMLHDVGAGGLSNAVPELVDHSHRGATIELREIPNAEPGMSPLEIWCNEAQERYVLAIGPADLDWFAAVCARERCPYAVLGSMDDSGRLIVTDRELGGRPVDMPLETLLGKAPQMLRRIERRAVAESPLDLAGIELAEACQRVLRMPVVADKSFLINIGDRTVGGLVARDQFVGPWQVPVSDVGVTALGFETFAGEAMAMGERAPVALLDAPASGRLAVAEALTNIAAASIAGLKTVRLSANWMAAAGSPGEDERLYDTVDAVSALCRELKIAIPVGKDSLSMQTRWSEAGVSHAVVAPVSLVVSAFAPVDDVRRTLTPQLLADAGTSLLLIDLGQGRNRLGASVLAQAFGRPGGCPPDLDNPGRLAALFACVQALRARQLLLAYHDRSDGGLFVTLCEMAFAGRAGLDIRLAPAPLEAQLGALFAEEPGVVLQVRDEALAEVQAVLAQHGLAELCTSVARVTLADQVRIYCGNELLLDESRTALHRCWSELSWRMQALRDNPEAAAEARDAVLDTEDPGLSPSSTFDPAEDVAAPLFHIGRRPRVAILREQGVNSQLEMAAAFQRAGFEAVDVHMTDLLAGRRRLREFAGLAACGGFSYGDVLGAGGGWAKSILFNPRVREEFAEFLARSDSFTLGVCNGCQMLSVLAELIPGATHWPRFRANRSGQFEARLSLVEVLESRSVLLAGMAGSRLLVPTSHGEGRAEFASSADLAACEQGAQLAIRYVDNRGAPAVRYPANPNGSPGGIAGLCSADGRVTILMPHPERVHRTVQHSWHPAGWGEDGPWLRLFRNARVFVGS